MSTLAPKYNPAEVESAITAKWDAARAFHAEPGAPGEPFCIVIPPPNVTGALHMGHALNNTLQDILVRHARMCGRPTLWMPGTDHAGIATQTVVEKRVLAEEGRKRTDFDRATFVAKIQAWKDEYERVILGQLKAMGCSCDWERTRFTMDPVCAAAVREAFFQLFRDGLIYRGKRLVNWDPATQTALADDEVENEEIDGHFYYLRYPLCDADGAPHVHAGLSHITVATTRPETMLGDTAVAVNPDDPRAAELRGKFVKLPIVGRVIPIIEDSYVVLADPDSDDPKAKMATGFLKVTPAHDPNDYEIGQRHGLPIVNVFSPTAAISKDHGWTDWDDLAEKRDPFCETLLGMDRYEARRAIVEWFRGEKLLQEVKPYRHTVGHSYRSHVPIEPYLSDQWYVKVTDDKLRGAALRAMAQRSLASPLAPLASRDREGASSPESPQGSVASRDREGASSPPPPSNSLAYLLTFTTYGTWLHGDARGSVDPLHNLPGTPVLHGDEQREREEHERLATPTVTLDGARRHAVQEAIIGVCSHRGWRLFALHVRTTHVHAVISADTPPERVMNDLKAYATRRLRESELLREADRLWTRHGSTRYLHGEASKLAAVRYVVEDQGEFIGPAPFDGRAQTLPHGRGSQGAQPWEGHLRFVPERYARTFEQWHENIRDWCISRQLWWGHRIPVWSCVAPIAADVEPTPVEGHECDARTIATLDRAFGGDFDATLAQFPVRYYLTTAPHPSLEGHLQFHLCLDRDDPALLQLLDERGWKQDPDVLDTWFSSGLWPISTMGWPRPEAFEAQIAEGAKLIEAFNPSSVLCTAREIITLWVSRMVMFNVYFRGCLPFTDVFIHAMIQDGEGRKMSKSLGNGVDPLDIIKSHGSDAMRFTLTQMTTQTQDVRMPVEKDAATGRNTSPKFDVGRNFANKLWNAVRFGVGILEEGEAGEGNKAPSPQPAPRGGGGGEVALVDRWILSRLAAAVEGATAAIRGYDFRGYADVMYQFVWNEFCDWYLEAIKPTVRKDARQRAVLREVMDAIVRLLHPMMPFVTERLWEALRGDGSLACRAAWPAAGGRDAEAEERFALAQRVVASLREVRTTYKVPPRQQVAVATKAPAELAARVEAVRPLVEALANATLTAVGPAVTKAQDAAAAVDGELEHYVAGLVDAGAERARLGKRIEEVERSITALEGRLANKGYIDRAPAHLVQQTRDQLAAAQREREALAGQMAGL